MDVCLVIKRRLEELGLEQKDLATAAEVVRSDGIPLFSPLQRYKILYPRFEYPSLSLNETIPEGRFSDLSLITMKIWFSYRVRECPRCRGGLVLRDASKRLLEHALILVFTFSPYRCGNCGQRFLGFRRREAMTA